MNLFALSDPHSKDGLARGTGGGRAEIGLALFGKQVVDALPDKRKPGEIVWSANNGLDTASGSGGEDESSTGLWFERVGIPRADVGTVFKQQPFSKVNS